MSGDAVMMSPSTPPPASVPAPVRYTSSAAPFGTAFFDEFKLRVCASVSGSVTTFTAAAGPWPEPSTVKIPGFAAVTVIGVSSFE